MATNIIHWLKVHSRWVKKFMSAKKCILIKLLDFPILFYYSFTLYIWAIFNSLNAGFFFNTIRVLNSLDPDQARHFVGPDLCPKLFAKVSSS